MAWDGTVCEEHERNTSRNETGRPMKNGWWSSRRLRPRRMPDAGPRAGGARCAADGNRDQQPAGS